MIWLKWLAYHLAFFTAINPLAYVFAAQFLCGAAVFFWQRGCLGQDEFQNHIWLAHVGRMGFAPCGGHRHCSADPFKTCALADSAPPLAPWVENLMMRMIGSDFLFWAGLHVARDALIKTVLATPPAQVAAASRRERARVNTMLDNILPVSARAAGLRSDSALGKSLGPYALASIRAPTLIIGTRDDGYGTYASAQYTASQIAGAKFIGFEQGGHTWVGHDDEVRAEILKLLIPRATP